EYDTWWLGTGLFARRERPGWEAEREALIELLAGLAPARVLDVACGTGFLTRHLRGDVTAIDQSPSMLEIASARMPDATLVCGEGGPLPSAAGAFDRVFPSHFYGHLLEQERERFVREARRAGRELVVVDSALRPGQPDELWQERKLEDGSRHSIYK